MIHIRKQTLPECEIHQILSNPRRREALRFLNTSPGRISVRDLSERIATEETGVSPPPRNVRESVYISLHQTHLPKLHDLGVINYDRERREIELLTRARDVDAYMEVVTQYGITWGEYYRTLGVAALLLIVLASAQLPVVSAIDPLLWASGFLGLFAVSTVYQFWTDRWNILRSFRR
ncbi:MAG: DUF7344 domain-containing protein [Halobacteriota archaeon]